MKTMVLFEIKEENASPIFITQTALKTFIYTIREQLAAND